MDLACQERFQAALRTHGLVACGTSPAPGHPAGDGLERSLRDLRRFEHVARRVGGAPFYDALLTGAGEALCSSPGMPAPQAMQRLRSIEILCGPERALVMMDRVSGPHALSASMPRA